MPRCETVCLYLQFGQRKVMCGNFTWLTTASLQD